MPCWNSPSRSAIGYGGISKRSSGIRRELPDLYEVYFWRYAVEFYSFDLIAACDDYEAGWSGQFEKAGRAVLPVGMKSAKFEPQRMECQQEMVNVPAASNIVRLPENCFEICWTAVPKHSDLYITTCDVTLPELWRCLAPEKATPKPQKRRRGVPSPKRHGPCGLFCGSPVISVNRWRLASCSIRMVCRWDTRPSALAMACLEVRQLWAERHRR